MNTTSLQSDGWGQLIRPGHLLLVETLGPEKEKITEIIAKLILRGPLRIMAGSDWLPAYALSRRIRQRSLDVKQILDRLYVARAFTCYQVLDLLEGTRSSGDPLLILDLLHNFYDPDIPLPTRLRILKQCSQHLERLSYHRPVAVLIQQAHNEDYQAFYSVLLPIADEILRVHEGGERISQPALL